jgi:osmotically-inducible protein OsmY
VRAQKAERAEAPDAKSGFEERIMKTFAIAAACVLAIAGCANQPRNSASGGTTSTIKQETKDAVLTAKVKSALAADVGLKTLKIDVDSSGESVTLKGTVDSADTKQRIEEVARTVKGVGAVKNELKVRGS